MPPRIPDPIITQKCAVESNKTYINQKDNGLSREVLGSEKDVALPSSVALVDVRNEAFKSLLSAEQRDRINVIPAELIILHAIDLPVRSARQRYAALPFALEEFVGCPIEQSHFALCGTLNDAKTLAAVLDANLMASWVTDQPDLPLIPEQLLISAGPSGADGRPGWRAYREGDRVVVRVSDGTGFAAQSAMLASLWRAALKPEVESYGAPLPAEMGWTDLSGTTLPQDRDLGAHDLRQGVHQPSRGLLRPLKYLAASVVLAAIGHLAISAADARAQRAIAEDLKGQAATALAARLPDASVEAAPDLILRQLSAQNRPQRGSSFLPLMDSVSKALLGPGDPVQFRQLNWGADGLRLTVEAPNLDVLQQAEARLKTAGLRVTSGSATADAGAARAELTVQR